MLHYALVFLLIALAAGGLGFGLLPAATAGAAKLVFVVFSVLAMASLLGSLRQPRA